ncbi:MAG: proton-conducting transporter membrane subunit [Eubacteriales bacterium]|nr:proton-conducting transporter membrane subunit [Eubacteriales bacterium]
MQNILFLAAPLVPAVCGLLCWFVPAFEQEKPRNRFVLGGLIATALLVIGLCLTGDGSWTIFQLTPSLPMVAQSDGLSRFFSLLIALMWLGSGSFGFGYLKHDPSPKRYYTFYFLTEGALIGLCFAGTLVSMYLCFEMMTLCSVALVLHNLTKEAVAAGVKYLLYSIAGAMMGLLGIFFFSAASTSATFVPGGSLDPAAVAAQGGTLLWVLFVTIVGFGTKAGMFPMHGWLPTAHPVAPAPASAVLSGVITKAGVLCIIRILYYVVGPAFVRGTWVQTALLALAVATVFMGSMLAFREHVLKKRLAYSTVSQVSYILFGLFLLNETAFTGALLHVWFHSFIKDALFLCAGAIILQTGETDVRKLRGIGKRMPVTVWCFTLCGVALTGIPPMSAFISKWLLAQGSLASGVSFFSWFGPVVLLVSALLTAGYLLPVGINGFFPGEGVEIGPRCEVGWRMSVTLIVLTVMTVVFGLCPSLLQNAAAAIASGLMM